MNYMQQTEYFRVANDVHHWQSSLHALRRYQRDIKAALGLQVTASRKSLRLLLSCRAGKMPMNSQIGDLDPLLDDTTKDWNLSWKPEGYSNQFTQQAILASAPAASGVYGLFNFDCQIFIGDAANIQEVLLRLEEQVDFQSQRLQPTGFTFELCPEDLRRQRASELIARYRPALQDLADLRAPSQGPQGAKDPDARDSESHSALQDLTMGDVPAHRSFSRLNRAGCLVVFALCVSVGAYYAFLPTGMTPNARSRSGAIDTPAPQVFAGQAASSHQPAAPISGSNPVRPAQNGGEEMARNAVRLVKSSNTDESEVQIRATSATARDTAERLWSVQVASVPAKDVAEKLAQELTKRGYDGYVIAAEVKGQTFYRVRAGRFAAREQAESTRQSLAGEEIYRRAYVTAD